MSGLSTPPCRPPIDAAAKARAAPRRARPGLRRYCPQPASAEVASQLGQVRDAEPDSLVVGLAGVTGVVEVVVAGPGGVQRVERRVAGGLLGTVEGRVQEPDPV